MALPVGSTYTLGSTVKTGIAPGGTQYSAPEGSQLKVKNTRTVGGQLYYDIDQTAYGGGTGWVLGSALESAVAAKKTSSAPSTRQEVTPALNTYQQETFQSKINPATKMAEIKELVKPSTPAPAVMNRTVEFENLRTQYNVADLEQTLNDLKAQQDEQYATLRQRKATERGKPVATNVIEGRMSEEERQYQEEADYLGRQVARITDELNTKYNVINQYMTYKGLDYQDAVQAYEREYAANMSVYGLVQQAQQIEYGQWKDKETAKRAAYEFDQTSARANLQIYMNAITSGNTTWESMSPDQQIQVQKLEMQSGMPVGTIASMGLSSKDRILTFSEDKTQAVVIGSNGQMQVISTGLSKSTSGTSAITATNNELKNYIVAKHTLAETFKKFGDSVAPNTIYETYNQYSPWGEAVESADELKKLYGVTSAGGVTQANVNRAKQLIIQNGGSQADLKKAETDPDFVNWVIANY